jgi:hypothetical protein
MNTELFENEGGRSFAAHPSCAVPEKRKKGKKIRHGNKREK